jgi:hypothetical protein
MNEIAKDQLISVVESTIFSCVHNVHKFNFDEAIEMMNQLKRFIGCFPDEGLEYQIFQSEEGGSWQEEERKEALRLQLKLSRRAATIHKQSEAGEVSIKLQSTNQSESKRNTQLKDSNESIIKVPESLSEAKRNQKIIAVTIICLFLVIEAGLLQVTAVITGAVVGIAWVADKFVRKTFVTTIF